jgi:hypothetical protein
LREGAEGEGEREREREEKETKEEGRKRQEGGIEERKIETKTEGIRGERK